eukprot:15444306-Alexandrium_andersonii.AAC.1
MCEHEPAGHRHMLVGRSVRRRTTARNCSMHVQAVACTCLDASRRCRPVAETARGRLRPHEAA